MLQADVRLPKLSRCVALLLIKLRDALECENRKQEGRNDRKRVTRVAVSEKSYDRNIEGG